MMGENVIIDSHERIMSGSHDSLSFIKGSHHFSSSLSFSVGYGLPKVFFKEALSMQNISEHHMQNVPYHEKTRLQGRLYSHR